MICYVFVEMTIINNLFVFVCIVFYVLYFIVFNIEIIYYL
jgi:hypothetical protein